MNKSLHQIGIEHETDKINGEHMFNGKSYMDRYDELFSSMRYDNITVLEIGVHNGSSIRAWREYFPNARIIGLDIDPRCSVYAGERIDVFTGSQSDYGALQAIISDTPNGIDIIIDDGSHLTDHLVYSFTHLFPHVNSGGWYVMEDLANSHRDLTGDVRGWQGMEFNSPETVYINKRYVLDGFILQAVRDLDHLRGDIDHFTVMSQMMAFKKR